MVNQYYSLQSQTYELKNQLDAKIQQERSEDARLSQHTTETSACTDAYHFSLPSGRGRGRFQPPQASTSFGRGRGTGPRHFPFLFPEEEHSVSPPPVTPVTQVAPAPGTPARRSWRQQRLSLLERAIQKATTEFQTLLQEEESDPEPEHAEEDVDRLIMEKAYEQYDEEHSAEVSTVKTSCNPFCRIQICIPNIKPYNLDAMLDTGAEISLLKYNAIPKDCWVPDPLQISFDSKKVFSPCSANIPVQLGQMQTNLMVHQFDLLHYDMLLGSDNLNNYMPYTICHDEIRFPQGSIPRLQSYQSVVPSAPKSTKPSNLDWLHKSISMNTSVIDALINKIKADCTSNNPHAFIHRKKHYCQLDFQTTTSPKFKAHHIGMAPSEKIECQAEIDNLLKGGFIQASKSPWSCPAFYVNKRSEQVRGKKRLVVNYKPLNKYILPVQHPIPRFYKNVAADRLLLNKWLRSNARAWNTKMTQVVLRIKQSCHSLPSLSLPGTGLKIVETDASEEHWGAVLKERMSDGTEKICRYASGSFKGSELNYHSSHKEIYAAKKAIQAFLFFLQHEKFLLRTDLQHFKGRLYKGDPTNKTTYGRLQRWAQWFDGYDFDVEHISGKKNALADFASRELVQHKIISVTQIVHEFLHPVWNTATCTPMIRSKERCDNTMSQEAE
ncbi:hypothetical protein KI387_038797 [Taxus chinensis]|uniref:Peptidase A2 domain-containing protein n=1 Tax=Taxus chinensis TaxID=29808 RepID=A0AA38F7F0_TAXCH|nr:hypothetical protein KI387_038797 [Taxus chinensis]